MTTMDLLTDWTTWLATDAPRRVRPTTIVSYRRQVTFFAAWLTGELGIELTPAAVTPMRLDSYLDDLRLRLHRKPATINLAVAALQSFGAWLVEAAHLASSPARRLRAIAEQERPPKALSSTIIRKLRDAAHHTGDLRDALVIDLLAHSGLRASEVAGIQIEQLERGARTTWIHVIGKGGKHRRVPLSKPVGQVLDTYLNERAEREGARPAVGPLLIGIRGGITRTTINRIVTEVAARSTLTPAEREQVTPHAFRHTVATELARSQHLVVAADMLGHASLTTTRRYVKASAEELEAAVDHLYH